MLAENYLVAVNLRLEGRVNRSRGVSPRVHQKRVTVPFVEQQLGGLSVVEVLVQLDGGNRSAHRIKGDGEHIGRIRELFFAGG